VLFRSLADLGRFDEAIEAYKTCITMNPGVATVLTNLGVSLANLRRFEEAIAYFDQALAIDPRDAMAWHDKGLALSQIGREEDAMACFEKYRELSGGHASKDMDLRPFK
jgi:tetratricopeptide (TPR) repeat protein